MSDADLTITQGDEKVYNLAFSAAGSAVDISGATITMSAVRNLSDTDPVLQKSITEHTDPTNGKSTITLTSTDTNIALGSYYYDIQINGGELNKSTVLKGRLVVTWQVTRD